MTVSTAFSSWSTVIQYEVTPGGGSFTDVAELKDITPPDFAVEDLEVTHQTSSDGYKEYIPGLVEGGEVTFDVNWVPGNATQQAVMAKIGGAAINWRIVYPTAVDYRWAFKAYVKGVNSKAPLSGAAEGSLTLKVTGKPVLETVP